jgi:hypothetical protein
VRASVIALCALLLAATGCGGGCDGSGGGPKPDAGDASCAASDDAGPRKANGLACGCNSDCQSGFCVDGVCCNSACTDTCKSCNSANAPGICSLVPNGTAGRATDCPATPAATCGLDGTCDGQGNCRKHPTGTVCQPGTCNGASVSNINICDGAGHCKAGPTTICAPFNCDATTNKCATGCTSKEDCAPGILCVNGSCGPKPNNAVCSKDSECVSGFCTDGVCCSTSCKGPCVSCNLPGRGGACFPIDSGGADPHGVCQPSPKESCGMTGACDGIGGCARFAPQTVCVAPSCSGDRLNTAGTCNGLGSCVPPGMQNCSPFRCVNAACLSRCTSDNDCVTGHACQAGSCGPKTNGQPCSAASECLSKNCVDNVCCDQACTGACRSCALLSALGTCTMLAAGADDTRMTCQTQAASTCGTDGKCDGAGGCRRYKMGTVCAAEHCENNKYTPESTCSATGTCGAPDAISCVPFACNGSKCFGSCSADANCSTGNVCTANSCGKKPNGAFCSAGTECASTICAQGICCATPCTGACKSCALSGTMGACTNVPTNSPDPAMTCVDHAGTCGTNGRCAAGACQVYGQGTPCGAATCPAGDVTLTPASTCDGAGACVTPPASSCRPFKCGSGACKSICVDDNDCASPNVCQNGSCGLRPDGASCSLPTDCQHGNCAQGVCCATACNGSCQSCAQVGSLGTCKPIPAGGVDPKGQCMTSSASTCGMTGVCDGAGGCQLYSAGTQCAAPTCPTSATTATLARTCDGSGTCRPATTQSCGAYACNGTTCNAVCGSDSDCSPGNVCNAGSCGLKRLGQLCAMGTECDSGHCTEGVCCALDSCGNCQSCNVAGLGGTCHPVGADEMEPHGGCTPSPPCGFTGKCDGNGACRNAPASTSCGTATCSGSTFTGVGNCDGAGTCVQPTTGCAPFMCGTGSCRTMCGDNTECVSGFTCMSNTCTNLKANGAVCTLGIECFSGHCTEGYCCDSVACGSCNSCAVPNFVGACHAVTAGGADPVGICMRMDVSTCGTNGTCDGAGHCATYAVGTACAATTCSGSTLTAFACNSTGQCAPAMTDCTPYACDGTTNVCRQACVDPSDCAATFVCNAPTCQPQ